MKLYIDGSGWNGKESKWCVVFEDGKVKKGILKEQKTNNEMEYGALIRALKMCGEGDEILTDSQLLVGQVTKGWKVTKKHLLPLVMQSKTLLTQKKVKLKWIPRRENLAGHLLERVQ